MVTNKHNSNQKDISNQLLINTRITCNILVTDYDWLLLYEQIDTLNDFNSKRKTRDKDPLESFLLKLKAFPWLKLKELDVEALEMVSYFYK